VAQSKSNKKIANSLVVMSSAAIAAVYSAGFVRTRPAANRIVFERSADLGPPARAIRSTDVPLRATESSTPPDHPQSASSIPMAQLPVSSPKADEHLSAMNHSPSRAEPNPRAIQAANAATEGSAAPTPRSSTEIVSTAPASTVSPSPTVASSGVAETPAAAAANPAATPPATPAPTASTTPVGPAAPVWKDGKYTAWGTCRHGDIQATVVIEAGRIVSAEITNCQTRYSCDVIENLPAKTVSRQKAKFDAIGGATESAYAYYGAVYWALDQASK
jgi:uncharacterized protein with FMN-binding domain